jgi:hypothetical protein
MTCPIASSAALRADCILGPVRVRGVAWCGASPKDAISNFFSDQTDGLEAISRQRLGASCRNAQYQTAILDQTFPSSRCENVQYRPRVTPAQFRELGLLPPVDTPPYPVTFVACRKRSAADCLPELLGRTLLPVVGADASIAGFHRINLKETFGTWQTQRLQALRARCITCHFRDATRPRCGRHRLHRRKGAMISLLLLSQRRKAIPAFYLCSHWLRRRVPGPTHFKYRKTRDPQVYSS